MNTATNQVCGDCGTAFSNYCPACDAYGDHGFAAEMAIILQAAESATPVGRSLVLVASNCGCCGAVLTDALSQELGIGPVCRKTHGYDARDIDTHTDWTETLAALGESCPEEVYAIAIHSRNLREDCDGLKGGRALANVLVRRLALARSGMVSDSIGVRCSYVAALSALGFRKLAERVARSGMILEIAVVDASGRIAIMRGKKERTSFLYPTVDAALASCRASYLLTIANGCVFTKPAAMGEGDWYVDARSGESVRMAFPGEPSKRPGLEKVRAWDYFARRVA